MMIRKYEKKANFGRLTPAALGFMVILRISNPANWVDGATCVYLSEEKRNVDLGSSRS